MSGRHKVQDATGIIVSDGDGNYLVSASASAPSDSAVGYQTGALHLDTSNKRHHINLGSTSSSAWARSSPVREIINVTSATKTLVLADSGSLVVLDKDDGIVVTLPEANSTNIGWFCDFLIKTTASSAGFSIDGASSSDLYYGHILITQDNTATAATKKVHLPNQSSHYKLAMVTAPKGWVQGGYFRVEIAAANVLVASGTISGVGTTANPFA
jgi:hypothetical protein